jgi:hypothetical protein
VHPEIRVQTFLPSVNICEICVLDLLTAKNAKKRKEQKSREILCILKSVSRLFCHP